MARRKSDSPQKAALREIMSNYLKENDVHIKDGTDVNSIMRDMMSIILEGTLDADLSPRLSKSIRIPLRRTWKRKSFLCTQRRSYCETSRLHCYRYRYVRQKRCSGHVRWGKRKRKILAFHHEQPEESRCGGDTDHLHRWPDRFPTGNRSRLSACRGPTC